VQEQEEDEEKENKEENLMSWAASMRKPSKKRCPGNRRIPVLP
jgi:hypothetical protein